MDSTSSQTPPPAAEPAEYFVWAPAGKRIAIHLNGEAVDQITLAVLRGFGAVPRRGAEVGGLLLGTVVKGSPDVVRIEEFVNVPIEHLHGPSYILSKNDIRVFDRELHAHLQAPSSPLHVVGFFRSNTRDRMQLSESDLALLDARFPDEDAVCLLVKPFATRPSEGVFLIREGGRFSAREQTGLFTFRRKEMKLNPAPRRLRRPPGLELVPAPPPEGAPAPPRAEVPVEESAPPVPPGRAQEPVPDAPLDSGPAQAELPLRQPGLEQPLDAAPDELSAEPAPAGNVRFGGPRFRTDSLPPEQLFARTSEPAARLPFDSSLLDASGAWVRPQEPARRSGWGWVRLAVLFLLLGAAIGAGVVMTIQPHVPGVAADPYDLTLTSSNFGNSFHLSWNPRALPVRQARGGELQVEQADGRKTQPLSAADLARGNVVYQGDATPLSFRLVVFLRARGAFSETIEIQPARAPAR